MKTGRDQILSIGLLGLLMLAALAVCVVLPGVVAYWIGMEAFK